MEQEQEVVQQIEEKVVESQPVNPPVAVPENDPPKQEQPEEDEKMTEEVAQPRMVIKARPGQGVGRTGAIIPQTICKMMSEAVKSGDIDKFM